MPSPGQGLRDFDVLSACFSAIAVSWLQKALIWLEPTFEVARADMKEGVTLFVCACMCCGCDASDSMPAGLQMSASLLEELKSRDTLQELADIMIRLQ